MADIDLDGMSRDELLKLRKDVDKAIENYETRRRQDAIAAAEAAAREAGYSLSELIADAPKSVGKKKVNPPKYRHPENPELTWTGKGRQPGWIKDGLEGGKSLDDFRIDT
jgi:DNA-binding protein H-NS